MRCSAAQWLSCVSPPQASATTRTDSLRERGKHRKADARFRQEAGDDQRVQQIQDYLIAAIQNVRILLAHQNPKPSAAAAVDAAGIYNKTAARLCLLITRF